KLLRKQKILLRTETKEIPIFFLLRAIQLLIIKKTIHSNNNVTKNKKIRTKDFYDLNDVSTKRNKCKSPETKLDLWIKRPPKTADNNNQSATEQKQKHGMKVDDNKCVKHDDDLIIDDDEIIDSLSSFSASKKIISNKNTLEFN
ncbi:5871_t:CDS:1, partial [Entrophospora sp. SA101]